MVDMMRKPVHWKLSVSPGMYRSSYKGDYQWHNEYEARSEEDIQKLRVADAQLKAKEFAVPWEEQATTYTESIFRERRDVIPAPSIKASSHVDDVGGRMPKFIASCPKALQQRKHFHSVLPVAESSRTKYYPATELAAAQAERSETLQALTEPEDELSYYQHLPAAAQTAGTAGMMLCREKLTPGWATYQHFIRETHQAMQHDAHKNRNMIQGSSVLVAAPTRVLKAQTASGALEKEDHSDCRTQDREMRKKSFNYLAPEGFDHDWRSVYNRDFQPYPGPHGGYYRKNELTHIFPKGENLNRDRWVSEYKDKYSIFLRRLNWPSQIPAVGLCSGKGIAMHTAQ